MRSGFSRTLKSMIRTAWREIVVPKLDVMKLLKFKKVMSGKLWLPRGRAETVGINQTRMRGEQVQHKHSQVQNQFIAKFRLQVQKSAKKSGKKLHINYLSNSHLLLLPFVLFALLPLFNPLLLFQPHSLNYFSHPYIQLSKVPLL
jgi:hypothetical protein